MKPYLPFDTGPDLITFIVVFFLLLGCQPDKDNTDSNGERGRTLDYEREVTFINQSGKPVTIIEVAVADEPSERSTGLMDVNNLPSDKGMLFIFETEEPRSFWMANTPLSLDIIFVNSEMEIVRIHTNTQPFSENNFLSGEPAKYVVEATGGFCITHDIQEGMKISISDTETGKTEP